MREWLEALSDKAREALSTELLELLHRNDTLSHAVVMEENMPYPGREHFAAAEMAEAGLHNDGWQEGRPMRAAAEEHAFLEAFTAGAGQLRQRTKDVDAKGDMLEMFSRRLEREDRRYDSGFPMDE